MFYYRVHEQTDKGISVTEHVLTASITAKLRWYKAPFCLDKCKCRKANKTDPCYIPQNVKFAVACSGRDDIEEIFIERIL